MDYQYLVMISPYVAHFPLMVLSDYFLWHVGKRTVGKQSTRIAFILMLTNVFMVEFEIRCFTNTLEKICTVIAYHFYMKQKDRFSRDTVIFTMLLTIGFMMRNTSPVGWVPLLVFKIVHEGSFIPFLISGIFIALPLMFLCIYLDSIYYQGANTSSTGTSLLGSPDKEFEWTVTSWNFVKVNVIQGLSKYFGDHGHMVYVVEFLPVDIFRGLYPLVIFGVWNYARLMVRTRRRPDLFYMSGFYILFFSFIGHKEPRFLLPILPFLFLMTGHGMAHLAERGTKPFLRAFFIINVIVEVLFFFIRLNFHDQFWDAMHYLTNLGDQPPHSLYTAHRYETPYYSWLHQRGQAYPKEFPDVNRTKLYVVN